MKFFMRILKNYKFLVAITVVFLIAIGVAASFSAAFLIRSLDRVLGTPEVSSETATYFNVDGLEMVKPLLERRQ